MDIRSSAEDFTAFLLECESKTQSGREVFFTYHVKSGRDSVEVVSATLLPAFVHTPLSEFTGPLPCSTVVLASQERLKVNEEESPELKAILNQFSDSVLEDFQEREEGGAARARSPQALVQVVKRETRFVGQKLSFKRRYLNQETDFHPGHGHDTTIHADLSRIQPLSLDLARALVSLYLVGSRMQPVSSLPAVWVPCVPSANSAAKEDIVGLACVQHEAQSNVYCVRDKAQSGRGDAGKKGDRGNVRSAEHGTASARYDILSSATDHVCGPQLAVEFVWEDPDALRAPPPSIGAEAVLHVSVEPGHLDSMATMFGEVQTLVSICQAVSEGEGRYFPGEDEGPLKAQVSLVDKVGEFFERMNTPLMNTMHVGVVSPSIENTVYKLRENLDFTENLWVFVKDAGSVEDLQTSLSAIFKSLLLGKVQHVILRESNNSSLAVLLRQLIRCKSMSERQLLAPKFQLVLATARMLQYVAEIGIDKVKRDLKGFLIGAKVANESEIDSFLGSNDGGMIAQAHSICRLYQVAELVGTLLAYHCLPTLSLVSLAKSAMDYYKQRVFTGFETTPRFSISLPRSSTVLRPIVDTCQSIPPQMWTLSSRSAARIRAMTTVDLTCGGTTRTGKHSFVYEATCHTV